MTQTHFTTNYKEILDRIQKIKPIEYGKNRNYVDGDVTYLSPYISRGVISTKMVLTHLIQRKYKLYEIEQFVKELAWRDYFQRVWQNKNINIDIKSTQTDVCNHQIPQAILATNCGIEGVNEPIQNLFQTGYMHNHCRMYTASIICNIAKSHWHHPAQWMYYYLLDGDWASNACSWQWVAGCNSSKKYFAHQENVTRFTKTNQTKSYLDDAFYNQESINIPSILADNKSFNPITILPQVTPVSLQTNKPTFIYNYYNLDSQWHTNKEGNRILLLEKSIFDKYPIHEHCIQFMLDLAKNIHGIQVFVGEFSELENQLSAHEIYYKEHPLNAHYKGIEEARDWMSNEVTGYYPSFFAYWKQLEKQLKKQFSA
jgi:deoxyribodipyrimidine photo-lyase